jgi:hypothetical protein
MVFFKEVVMVRAKMICEELVLQEDEGGGSVKLRPVTCGSAENDNFYRYTPAGSLALSVINSEAVKQFELGRSYYVDVSPADCGAEVSADESPTEELPPPDPTEPADA